MKLSYAFCRTCGVCLGVATDRDYTKNSSKCGQCGDRNNSIVIFYDISDSIDMENLKENCPELKELGIWL